jgi:outer membrane protein assembly factor BamB
MFHGSSSHTGYINVVGPQTVTLKWKVFTGKYPAASNSPPNSVAVSTNDVVYVGGPQSIMALNAASGQVLWYKNYTSVQGPAVAADGTIYFVAKNSIIALYSNGNQKWQYVTGNSAIFGPIIGADGTIYQGSWDHYFYAINPDGTLKWRYLTGGCVSYSPSIGSDGTIYLGGGDAHCGGDPNLYAFNTDGMLKWKYNTGQLRVGTPAVTSTGVIYVPAGGPLYALNPDGTLKWSLGLPPAPPSKQPAGIITPAVGSDGTLYVGNSNGIFSAIDSTTQSTKWTYQTGPDPAKTPAFYGLLTWPIVDSLGNTYVGATDYNMYAFDSRGTLLWKYLTGGELAEAAPAIDSNGNLYFSSADGYTYALAGPTQPTTTTTTSSTSSTSSTTSASSTTNSSSITTTSTTTTNSTTTPIPEFSNFGLTFLISMLIVVGTFVFVRMRRNEFIARR